MIRLPLIVLLSSLTVLSSAPVRGACTDGPEVCVDGPGSKFINGVEVWRECWNYQTTRHCTSSSTVDYCSGLKQTPGCRQTKAECLSYSLTGTCMSWNSTYICSEEAKETENIEILDSSHTVISGTDTTTCSSFLDNPDCYIAEEKCIEGPETRIINGVAVYKECWKKELAFACAAPGASNSCQIIASKGCQPIGEKVCERVGADGSCAQYSQKFHCVNTDPIEGDDITPEGTPAKPGFDLLACKTATEGMTCKASGYSCMQTNDKGECIQRKYIYNCTKSLNENACEALEKLPECEIRKSTCIERDGPKCLAYKKEIFCKGDSEISAPGADIIDSNIVIGSIEPSDTCLPLKDNPACTVLRTECVEGPAEKIINGVPVYKDCWKYEYIYVCGASGNGSEETKNDCGKFEADKDCVKVSSECIAVDDEGKCLTTAHTYRCVEKEGSAVTETICRPAECLDGVCEGSGDPADSDFSKVITMLETARQGALYGDYDNGRFFNGEVDECSKKVLGFSCCDTKVKAGTANSSAFGKAMSFAGDVTVETVKYIGSPYVYDVLSASDATSGILNMLYGDATSGIYNPSLSFYGFGMTLQGGQMYFTFDPTSFAMSVALQIALDYLQCEPKEQTLMLKKGQKLCHHVGTYCSKKVVTCVERKESYCCYNSPLARILQEQGRPQLGKGWGSAQNPQCEGFTQDELERLDFDAMDLSEFEALIVQKNELDSAAAQDRGTAHTKNLVDKNLGAYVPPSVGSSHVVDPNFTGTPTAPNRPSSPKAPSKTLKN